MREMLYETKLTLSPVLLSILITMFFSLVPSSPSLAAEIDCFKCHEKLKQGKSVHQALTMGCTTCHTGIDASTVPHKKTNKCQRASRQHHLLYAMVVMTRLSLPKNIHPPIASGGCTTCHAPHSSDEIAYSVARLWRSVPSGHTTRTAHILPANRIK